MDIFEGGSGQLDIAGQVYDIHRDNNGRNWVADHMEGDSPGPSFTAANPADLARRIADHHGVTGAVSIQDERPGGRSATTRFEHTAKPRKVAKKAVAKAPVPAAAAAPTGGVPTRELPGGITRIGGLRDDQQWVTPSGRVVANPTQQDIIQGRVKLRTTPTPAGTGPGNVAVGGTDADRRAARPRMEGESDRAYAIRTAPSRDAALRLLNGHQLAGLRAIAREENVVTASGDTKAGLVERLMRALHDRHADSVAITDMVNRDRTPPPVKAAPATPRATTPAAGGSITPTMTGAQLIAARRKLQAEQQGGGPAPTNPATGRTVRPLAGDGPFRTITPADAEVMQRRMAADRPWTPKQRTELRRYTGGDYVTINGHARNGGGTAATQASLTEIRGSMREIPEGITLSRNVRADAFGLTGRNGGNDLTDAEIESLRGRTYHDPGLTSASVNSRGSGVALRISVPAGTRGAYVDSISKNQGETEMILDAGTHYRIDRVQRNLARGGVIVYVTVVGQDD